MVHSESGLWDFAEYGGTLRVDRLSRRLCTSSTTFSVRIVMKPLIFALCVLFAMLV